MITDPSAKGAKRRQGAGSRERLTAWDKSQVTAPFTGHALVPGAADLGLYAPAHRFPEVQRANADLSFMPCKDLPPPDDGPWPEHPQQTDRQTRKATDANPD
jgi:hypothetical protein